jgi:hypothetical protein
MGRPHRRGKKRKSERRELRLVARIHPELQRQFSIVLGVVGLLLILALIGASEEVLMVLGIIAALAFVVTGLLRGAPAQYEIVSERRGHDIETESEFHGAEDIESVSSSTSGELQRALGAPLAAELRELENELLEEAANGRLPVKDVAQLAQELAKTRTELIEEATDDAATGQPHSKATMN